MLIVYTGNGKGKTSAAVGQTLRSLGWGFRVCFGQFMKRDNQAGEQIMLKKLLGSDYCSRGPGFFLKEDQRSEQIDVARELLDWSKVRIGNKLDMLTLDEAIYALNMEIVTRWEIEDITGRCRESNVHLVLTGRNAPPWLVEMADLVSDIQAVKHPFGSGVSATRGTEY